MEKKVIRFFDDLGGLEEKRRQIKFDPGKTPIEKRSNGKHEQCRGRKHNKCVSLDSSFIVGFL